MRRSYVRRLVWVWLRRLSHTSQNREAMKRFFKRDRKPKEPVKTSFTVEDFEGDGMSWLGKVRRCAIGAPPVRADFSHNCWQCGGLNSSGLSARITVPRPFLVTAAFAVCWSDPG